MARLFVQSEPPTKGNEASTFFLHYILLLSPRFDRSHPSLLHVVSPPSPPPPPDILQYRRVRLLQKAVLLVFVASGPSLLVLLVLTRLLGVVHEDGFAGFLEDQRQVLLRQGRALDVFEGVDLLRQLFSLREGGRSAYPPTYVRLQVGGDGWYLDELDRCEIVLLERGDRLLVVSQIQLGADQDDWCLGIEVRHLGHPLQRSQFVIHFAELVRTKGAYLVLHIVKTFGRGERETDDEHISSWVAEGPELIVLPRTWSGREKTINLSEYPLGA
jgi:hypothetical protein